MTDSHALCDKIIAYLNQEYDLINSNAVTDLSGLLQEKKLLLQQLETLNSTDRTQILQIQQLLNRNAAMLRGRIEGIQDVIAILQHVDTTGIYGPDGERVEKTPSQTLLFESA